MPGKGNEGKVDKKYDRGSHPEFGGVDKGSRKVNKVGSVTKKATEQGPTTRRGKKNSFGG